MEWVYNAVLKYYPEAVHAHEKMAAANLIADANNHKRPFTAVDIRFKQFLETVVNTQREKDLITVSEFFSRMHNLLTNCLQVDPHQYVSQVERHELSLLIPARQRLNCLDLLTDDLDQETIEQFVNPYKE